MGEGRFGPGRAASGLAEVGAARGRLDGMSRSGPPSPSHGCQPVPVRACAAGTLSRQAVARHWVRWIPPSLPESYNDAVTSRRQFLSLLASASGAAAASPANWPQFRGRGSLGTSEDDPRLPVSWSATENVVWKTQLPGMAWASPVVWGDRVFLTNVVSEGAVEAVKKGLYFGGNRHQVSQDRHRWTALGIDFESGEIAWETELHAGVPPAPRHLKNSYASETPVTDGERVYAHFGYLGTWCLSVGGDVVWKRGWKPYRVRHDWGTAASPVLHEGRLYLVNDNEERSTLSCLDKLTGSTIWEVGRDEGSNWSTPFVWENPIRTEIVTTGTDRVRSYDLDGKLLWELGGMSSIVIPVPFAGHGLLYLSSGYVGDQKRPVFAIRPGAKGDISLQGSQTENEFIAWFRPQAAPYNPSPLLYEDLYYTLYDRGFLTCHDALSGEEVYGKQRFEAGANAFSASPWAYNDRVFCLSEDGDCFVIEHGREYRLAGKNSLGELCMATPAIAQGSLILRGALHLYRIGG